MLEQIQQIFVLFHYWHQGLSEAKMELRRKEQSIRQLSKQLSHLEEEKRSLKDGVQDVQEVLRSTNK